MIVITRHILFLTLASIVIGLIYFVLNFTFAWLGYKIIDGYHFIKGLSFWWWLFIVPLSIYLPFIALKFVVEIPQQALKGLLLYIMQITPSGQFGGISVVILSILGCIWSIYDFWLIPHAFHFKQIAGCVFFTIFSLLTALDIWQIAAAKAMSVSED
jgi:hypothetical protein